MFNKKLVNIMKNRQREPPLIAITGGKGGTGKTTVAINLAYTFSKKGKKVLFLDCDVDAPNAAILLGADLTKKEEVNTFVPKFTDSCISCGDCQLACQPNALLNIEHSKPLLFPELCTGCEACRLVCNYEAIKRDQKLIGNILIGKKFGIDLIVGELKIGEPKSAEVVQAIRDYASNQIKQVKYDLILLDTAPGAHCDIMHALNGATLVISVTEPTPFGSHDLNRILELINLLPSKPDSKIIVNRSDLTQEKHIFDPLIRNHAAPILGKIPMSREVQLSYARGVPVGEAFPKSKVNKFFEKLSETMMEALS